MKPTTSSRKRVDGMFEFVFVVTAIHFLLGLREREGVIDKCLADNARAEYLEILESGNSNCCARIQDWAIRCYNIPGLTK